MTDIIHKDTTITLLLQLRIYNYYKINTIQCLLKGETVIKHFIHIFIITLKTKVIIYKVTLRLFQPTQR